MMKRIFTYNDHGDISLVQSNYKTNDHKQNYKTSDPR